MWIGRDDGPFPLMVKTLRLPLADVKSTLKSTTLVLAALPETATSAPAKARQWVAVEHTFCNREIIEWRLSNAYCRGQSRTSSPFDACLTRLTCATLFVLTQAVWNEGTKSTYCSLPKPAFSTGSNFSHGFNLFLAFFTERTAGFPPGTRFDIRVKNCQKRFWWTSRFLWRPSADV